MESVGEDLKWFERTFAAEERSTFDMVMIYRGVRNNMCETELLIWLNESSGNLLKCIDFRVVDLYKWFISQVSEKSPHDLIQDSLARRTPPTNLVQ